MGKTLHNKSKSLSYISWQSIKQRCLNPNATYYKYYGGKGITICKEWFEFKNFLKDMGDRPSKEYSIDRIDSNKNYNKNNCRWVLKSINTYRTMIKHGLTNTKEYKTKAQKKYYNKYSTKLLKQSSNYYFNNKERISLYKKQWWINKQLDKYSKID